MSQTERIAVVAGAALVIAATMIGGIYAPISGAASNPTGGTVYVVNRFTGSARVCTVLYCRPLREAESVPTTGEEK